MEEASRSLSASEATIHQRRRGRIHVGPALYLHHQNIWMSWSNARIVYENLQSKFLPNAKQVRRTKRMSLTRSVDLTMSAYTATNHSIIYSLPREQWICCGSCGDWAHFDCTALDCGEDFVCEFCLWRNGIVFYIVVFDIDLSLIYSVL